MPPSVIDYMQHTFVQLHFVDMSKIPLIPSNVSMRGFQIKPFAILLSSFEEVFWLDTDNHPLVDPKIVFDFKQYQEHGALFWPDFCNIITMQLETFDFFRLPRPTQWPSLGPGATATWSVDCELSSPFDLETGQIVLHKKKAWAGLIMTVFINLNYKVLYKTLLNDDKQTFAIGFNVTRTPYNMVNHHPFGIGRSMETAAGVHVCANTMGQRHPETGQVIFMHRNWAKFKWTVPYMNMLPDDRAWYHIVKQSPRSGRGIELLSSSKTPSLYLPGNGIIQSGCFVARGPEASTAPITQQV